MPGILPMKVIKVGCSTQARIAQACDRCRSKKIRCDGLTPTCTQCSSVGFECKTSDKLSRRAFPRGYTESLEDRVRALESEVRELKDLLDEKDEKIDMLSKMHAQTPSTPRKSSLTPSIGTGSERRGSECQQKEEVFKLQQLPYLISEEGSDASYMGSSSGRSFIDAFKRKLQESGKSCSDFDTACFSVRRTRCPNSSKNTSDPSTFWRALPRLASDQLVNIYFQEWAPLFPILHRPSFLALYEQYVSDPSKITDMKSLAQLNLVFGIAALSNEPQTSENVEQCERQWTKAMKAFALENSISNLQCLLLAQLFCIQRGDYANLLHYKSLAIGLAQRLGLNMSQKRFALGALTVETRKKVFWTLYTLDCFSAAALGLPKLLRDEDISCEYPADADDEYVTEEGFKATLPGEFTKLSSALALFRGSRVLSKVLQQNYPSTLSQGLSLRNIAELDEQLNAWSDELAPHLRMEFVQDKPSVQVVSSRCPILSLTYHYIRTLIHRPAVCANLGDKASSSIVALASSSKHVIQLLQLLDERGLSFSFCVNKNELITTSGFGILFQALGLDKDSKMMKDNGKSICSIIELLERRDAPGAAEFKRVGCSMLSVVRKYITPESKRLPASAHSVAVPVSEVSSNTQKQLQALADRYAIAAAESDKVCRKRGTKDEHQNSAPVVPRSGTGLHSAGTPSTANSSTVRPHSSSPRLSVPSERSGNISKHSPPSRHAQATAAAVPPNLDYFQMSTELGSHQIQHKLEPSFEGTVWDDLLHTLDGRHVSVNDSAYYEDMVVNPSLTSDHAFAPALHRYSTSDSSWTDVWDLGLDVVGSTGQPAPQSVLSFSDDSLSSGEDFGSIDFGSAGREGDYGGIMMPNYTPESLSPAEMAELDVLQALVGL